MITKDGRDTPIERLTPENYIVPKGEEMSYHVVIEVETHDRKTGVRTSKPRLQKFGKKSFESFVLNGLRKQGYNVTILYDPNTWIKERLAKVEQSRAEKAKAEQERFDAAVAAAVSKALAEQAEKAKTDAPDYSKGNPDYAKEKKPGRPAKSE